jgi:N-acetylglucosaminyl-diphospho-decaprenol L-rhamnosyltransferase
VVIDFNSYERTLNYIEDFLDTTCSTDEISFVVVDNSTEKQNFNKMLDSIMERGYSIGELLPIQDAYLINSVDRIYSVVYKKSIKLILAQSKANYGFAKGNNIGAVISKSLFNPDYLIFSNNDINFPKLNFDLNKFIEIFNTDSKTALIGPNIIGLDEVRQSPHKKVGICEKYIVPCLIWPFNSIIAKLFKIKFLDGNDIIDVCEDCFVYRIIGAFMVFDATKFFEISMFDENTFLYAEELIIAEKLKRLNYKTYFLYSTNLIHEEGYSTKKEFTKLTKLKQMFKSNIYYYEKYVRVNELIIILAKISFGIFCIKKLLANKIINFKSD